MRAKTAAPARRDVIGGRTARLLGLAGPCAFFVHGSSGDLCCGGFGFAALLKTAFDVVVLTFSLATPGLLRYTSVLSGLVSETARGSRFDEHVGVAMPGSIASMALPLFGRRRSAALEREPEATSTLDQGPCASSRPRTLASMAVMVAAIPWLPAVETTPESRSSSTRPVPRSRREMKLLRSSHLRLAHGRNSASSKRTAFAAYVSDEELVVPCIGLHGQMTQSIAAACDRSSSAGSGEWLRRAGCIGGESLTVRARGAVDCVGRPTFGFEVAGVSNP